MYGQDELPDVDQLPKTSRGTIPNQLADEIRKTRAAEPWTVFDTVCIGPGCRLIDPGWFNNWNEFARAQRVIWFRNRAPSVDQAYTNKGFDKLDYAYDIHLIRCEFYAPPGLADSDSVGMDAQSMPLLFATEFPNRMSAEVVLMQTDPVLIVPFSHMPSGIGTTWTQLAAPPAPTTLAGTQGHPSVGNGYIIPGGLMMAANSSLQINGYVAEPLKSFLMSLPLTMPGVSTFTNGEINSTLEKRYMIRIGLIGERYVQLRGARSVP